MVHSSVTLVAALAALVAVYGAYFAAVLGLESPRTRELRYFGLPRAARRRFQLRLRIHRLLLAPALWLISRRRVFRFPSASIRFDGVTAPKGSCSPASFEEACRYQPRPHDIFVVTQMKSGTTWMQQVVYELLTRGQQDLVACGRPLASVSPWLESLRGVPVAAAPRVGSSRLIKTHLPARLCPFSHRARYVYVVRQPVSCFASCRDFLRANLQMFAPPADEIEAWFCSPQMWWTAWPEHVAGWWKLARECDNVLFVRFEDMKCDLPAVVQQVSDFLQLEPLTPHEFELVLSHCSYGWMREHAEVFEPQPPHLLRSTPRLFAKGSRDRYRDVPLPQRERILAWCSAELVRHGVPDPVLRARGESMSIASPAAVSHAVGG